MESFYSWISTISTFIVAVATIIYVIITNRTLKFIKAQFELNNEQLKESVRFTSLTIQPFISITNTQIIFSPPDTLDNLVEYVNYYGLLYLSFDINNTGLGPSLNIQLSSFLITNTADSSNNKIASYVFGVTSAPVSYLEKGKSINCLCKEYDDCISDTYIKILESKEIISFILVVYCIYQDLSGQLHIQKYHINPISEKSKNSIIENIKLKALGGKRVFEYICDVICLDKTKIDGIGIPLNDYLKAYKDNLPYLSSQPIFKDIYKIILEGKTSTSSLFSSGLPSSTVKIKKFELSIPSQLRLACCDSSENAITLIKKDYEDKILSISSIN